MLLDLILIDKDFITYDLFCRSFGETLSTLHFARRAKLIKNKVNVYTIKFNDFFLYNHFCLNYQYCMFNKIPFLGSKYIYVPLIKQEFFHSFSGCCEWRHTRKCPVPTTRNKTTEGPAVSLHEWKPHSPARSHRCHR